MQPGTNLSQHPLGFPQLVLPATVWSWITYLLAAMFGAPLSGCQLAKLAHALECISGFLGNLAPVLLQCFKAPRRRFITTTVHGFVHPKVINTSKVYLHFLFLRF